MPMTSLGRSSCLSASPRHSSITSRMFSINSSSVAPCECAPWSPGSLPMRYPSSPRSTTTVNSRFTPLCYHRGSLPDERFPQAIAICAADEALSGALRMGHHPENVAAGIDDSGDVSRRAVGVRIRRYLTAWFAVTEDNAALEFEFVERLRIGKVIAFTVRNRHTDNFAVADAIGPGCRTTLAAQVHPFTAKLEALVAHQRARKKVAFAKHLEAVADADDRLAAFRKRSHGIHHRRKTRDRPRAEVVPVRKTTGQHHGIEPRKVRLAVPDDFGLLLEHVMQHVVAIA